ncbi:MAG TPA: phosphate ABC transporter substrate-binding protein [Methanospirillum sp.]|uniref:phosphate ABC transporter substrate-binding protein n=1 Tax=Methanospirillum sp. TaxID=45200 RepID=UPI002BF002EB|nr:phosphate ABC transporter substrate-binding protein [Methanospirillum sp.]HWQ63551.1 phosphate ABC transporter substrate-binding protein [Methanospirillum sp.]
MMNSKTAMLGCILIGLLLCSVLMAGCTGNSSGQTEKKVTTANTTAAAQAPATAKATSGGSVLTVAGSTTVLPVAAKAAESYMAAHPGIDVQVTGGGSGAGVKAAGEGTTMIGMASRDLSADEKTKYPDLKTHQIAIDGLAFITNPKNPIPSLTLEQVKKIYDGNITNWKDVGGSDAAIVVVGRDSASGSRDFMTSSVMKNADYIKTQLEKNSNGAVQQTIAQTENAIGYVGLGYIDSSVHAVPVSVNGTTVTPSIETVKAGTYPLARPLYLLTKGEPSGDATKFIAFIDSPDGQKLVTEEGFVTLTK